MSEELETGIPVSSRNEWIKFGVLAAILLGVVLIVAALRPFIFNKVVPAVMGESMTQPLDANDAENAYPIMIPVVTDSPGGETIPDETPVEEPSSTESSEPLPEEAAYPAPEPEVGEEAVVEEEVVDEAQTVEEETAVSTFDHIVQPNENLTSIARLYGTTIEAVLDVNDIPDPNRIDAGTVLRIPQP